jgi:hypothetical protein
MESGRHTTRVECLHVEEWRKKKRRGVRKEKKKRTMPETMNGRKRVKRS